MLWTLHYVCQKPYCIVSGPEIPIDAKPVQVVAVDALLSDEALEAGARALFAFQVRGSAMRYPEGHDETYWTERARPVLEAVALAIASSDDVDRGQE